MTDTARPESWIKVTPDGLFVVPGGFHIDPILPVARAVITHGHADHARPGNTAVLATPQTLAIMATRFGAEAGAGQPLTYGECIRLGDVDVRLVPAGHVLGSAQIVLEHGGCRVVVSGDYKRRPDPTCAAFEPVQCDVFVTEATFGLPVFRHPPIAEELAKIAHAQALYPDRAIQIGVYNLGKCQRLIAELRAAGYDRPIWLHGALLALCDLYTRFGVALGPLLPATEAKKADLKGQIVLAPPSAQADRWSRRLPDPVVAVASGWMRVRQRARQRGVELPLIISDHADWDELLATVDDTGAGEVWVTHGREEALVFAVRAKGKRARALALVGFDEDEAS